MARVTAAIPLSASLQLLHSKGLLSELLSRASTIWSERRARLMNPEVTRLRDDVAVSNRSRINIRMCVKSFEGSLSHVRFHRKTG